MLTIESLTNVILSICDDVSNKKLQKLAYYIYAWHMTLYGVKIANMRFEAWEHGPVCRNLYNKYRHYGWSKIPTYKGFVLVDDEKIRFIQSVLNVYGDFSADELEAMTHKELPWIEARSTNVANAVISDITIKTFYLGQNEIKNKIIGFIKG
ncbi:MAG: DUF4065 domain-containing protein [Lachnospiraceae bacterium]|nr:DUF4065 domain-containing protein [Lachnospiraceae bacterium]